MIIRTWMAKSHCLNHGSVTRFFDAGQKSSTRIYVVSRQINKETGHIKTSKYLVRRMVQRVKRFTA